MTEVIILRHGETESEDILKGSLDTEVTNLSREGLLNTIVTARAIRDYYGAFPHFYFAYGPYRRAKQTSGIIGTVVPSRQKKESETDLDYLPPDQIYLQELLGAKPLKFKHLRERNFGSLEKQKLSRLTQTLLENMGYPNLTEFLLYGSSEDFVNLAKKLGIESPEPGEDYLDVFDRAYRVSNRLLNIIETIGTQREKSVIVLTTHRIFGNYLINAVINSISALRFQAEFEGDRKFSRHLLFDYDLKPCRFARLDITVRKDKIGNQKPHCIVKEINDRGHLVCIDSMSNEERDRLIEEAKNILRANSKNT